MTFNTEVKNEILSFWTKKQCCKRCETLGMLFYSTDFSSKKIGLKSENELITNHYIKTLKKSSNVDCNIERTSKGLNKAYLSDENRILVLNNYNLFVAEKLFQCENCKKAFLRGAFLAGGSISEPSKEYRLEFICKSEDISCFLYRILFELSLEPKMTIKNKKVSVYLKDSESIEDLLTLMNASKSSLEIMNTKILKDIRNNANRKTNFETANIKKAANSSAKHIQAINKLQDSGKFNALPDDLKQIAIARKENFELSLSELGKLFSMSRSGIYHRLKKICDIADES